MNARIPATAIRAVTSAPNPRIRKAQAATRIRVDDGDHLALIEDGKPILDLHFYLEGDILWRCHARSERGGKDIPIRTFHSDHVRCTKGWFKWSLIHLPHDAQSLYVTFAQTPGAGLSLVRYFGHLGPLILL